MTGSDIFYISDAYNQRHVILRKIISSQHVSWYSGFFHQFKCYQSFNVNQYKKDWMEAF